MASMRDVAALAGVSITTVSHVLNETRPVHEATRARVHEAVAATGYTTNQSARALVTGGTRLLGVAIPPLVNPYFAELLAAVEAAASTAGYTLVLADTRDDPDTESRAVATLRSRRVEGVLLTPSASSTVTSGALRTIAGYGVPTVLVDRLIEEAALDEIAAENVQGTSTLTAHLATVGHRRIAMLSASAGATRSERELGYRLGLGRAKLAWDPTLVRAGGTTVAEAAAAAAALLDAPEAPSAVVASNNTMLRGVLLAARERGLAVGSDLAVVGYDEVDWAEFLDPPLTTMATPITELGSRSVEMLLTRIAEPGAEPHTVRLPTKLVHRRSCGCR
jgi:LacI family transcriptional regulator